MTGNVLPGRVPGRQVEDPSIWRLVGVLAVAGFASTFAWRSVEPLVKVLAHVFGRDERTVALLSTAFALPYAIIQPVLGPIGDAFGKRRVMIVCLAALTMALIGCSLTPSLGWLFGLRMIAGAAAGGVIPIALALVGDRVPMAGRQVAIGRLIMAVVLGQFVGLSFSGVIESTIGWRGVFATTALVALLGLAAIALGFTVGPQPSPTPSSFSRSVAQYRSILATPRARVLFCSVFVEALSIFGIFPHMSSLIAASGSQSARQTGLALSGFAIGGLLYSGLVAVLVRWLGVSRMLRGGGLVCAGSLLAIGFTHRWQVDFLALLALGFGFYMLHNTFQTQVTEVAPQARASAVALHACCFFCGQAVAVVLLGQALAALGQSGALGVCALVILCLGGVSDRLLREPSPAVTA